MSNLELILFVILPLVAAYAACVAVTPGARQARRDRRTAAANPLRHALNTLARRL